jgi:hypothetical protein
MKIRLTESKLKQIVSETVKKVLNEKITSSPYEHYGPWKKTENKIDFETIESRAITIEDYLNDWEEYPYVKDLCKILRNKMSPKDLIVDEFCLDYKYCKTILPLLVRIDGGYYSRVDYNLHPIGPKYIGILGNGDTGLLLDENYNIHRVAYWSSEDKLKQNEFPIISSVKDFIGFSNGTIVAFYSPRLKKLIMVEGGEYYYYDNVTLKKEMDGYHFN